jgi:hypothetical protein
VVELGGFEPPTEKRRPSVLHAKYRLLINL